MSNLKKKILNKLHERTVTSDELEDATGDLVQTAKNALDIDDKQAKDYVSGFIGEDTSKTVQYHSDRTDETPFMINNIKWQYVNAIYPDGKRDIGVYRYGHDLVYDYKWFMDNVVNQPVRKDTESIGEVNQEVMDSMIKQYGSKEAAEKVYYATANKQDRDPENFHAEGEDDSVGRGIEHGMNPEVESDKYEEYRKLMQQLASEEGDNEINKKDMNEDETLLEYGNSTKFDLRDDNNVKELMDGVVRLLGRYMGTDATNSAAIGNDNRVIIWDLINSGKLKQEIGYRLSPTSMHYGSHGKEYWSNNKEAFKNFMKRQEQPIDFTTKGDADRGKQQEQVQELELDEPKRDPVKLKNDVQVLLNKLDMSAIAPYMVKINTAVEQAEIIGQFAEKIGVPRNKLSAIVSNLKVSAKQGEGQPQIENTNPSMTKNKLIETVTGKKPRKVIKTVKVKDIK